MILAIDYCGGSVFTREVTNGGGRYYDPVSFTRISSGSFSRISAGSRS
jgi:hypothetical protein